MKEISNVLDSYNVVVGGFVAFLTAVFGPHWYLFAAFLFLNVVDWMTGWYKARILHKESSGAGLAGVVKKVGYWIIIAVAFLMAYIFIALGQDILHIDLGFLTLLGWFTLACLLVNEVRSVLENLVECGYNVPNILIRGLAVTEKMLDKAGEIIPDIENEKTEVEEK